MGWSSSVQVAPHLDQVAPRVCDVSCQICASQALGRIPTSVFARQISLVGHIFHSHFHSPTVAQLLLYMRTLAQLRQTVKTVKMHLTLSTNPNPNPDCLANFSDKILGMKVK